MWLALLLAQSSGLSRRASALAKATVDWEGYYHRLSAQAAGTRDALNMSRHVVEDLFVLQAVPNLLPQDKGYGRTQKVVSEEVGALRRQLAPRLKDALHIIIDAKANKLYLKKGFKLLWQADCSVGRGGVLQDKKTGRRWEFVTPRGEFRVIAKAPNPEWRKPDWAYVETGEPIPPPDDPARTVQGELGAFVLNLGDGYLIHGTKNEALLGRPASHGCVRLGAADLKDLYDKAPIGTRAFIFY